MPCKPRLVGHVYHITRAKSQKQVPLLCFPSSSTIGGCGNIFGRDHKQPITPNAETDKAPVRLFTDISVHHHGVPWAVQIDYGGLSSRIWV